MKILVYIISLNLNFILGGSETISNVVNYFKTVEKNLPSMEEIDDPLEFDQFTYSSNANNNQPIISNVLSDLANDSSIGNLDSAQKADYLRGTS